MTFKTWMPAFLVAAGMVSNAVIMFFLYKRRIPHKMRNWILSSAPNSTKIAVARKPLYEVVFFPDREVLCKHFVFSNGEHCGSRTCTYSHEKSSFFKFTQHLLRARQTLDVCVYTICHELLADIMIELHKQRGVHVRIITDDEALTSSNCQICRLKSNGIAVRVDLTNTLMHHKFVVVDKKLLINGSFNWSFNAVTRNNDNVLITDAQELVSPYKNEFEKLWQLFDPDKRSTSTLDFVKQSKHSDL